MRARVGNTAMDDGGESTEICKPGLDARQPTVTVRPRCRCSTRALRDHLCCSCTAAHHTDRTRIKRATYTRRQSAAALLSAPSVILAQRRGSPTFASHVLLAPPPAPGNPLLLPPGRSGAGAVALHRAPVAAVARSARHDAKLIALGSSSAGPELGREQPARAASAHPLLRGPQGCSDAGRAPHPHPPLAAARSSP
jgi:hypothetical protein